MHYTNNESFLAGLDKDYPNVDWDNLSPEESVPSIWKINGYTIEIENGKLRRSAFGVDAEYASKELAEVQVQYMKDTWTCLEHDSIEIYETLPLDQLELYLMRDLRAKVLIGEKVFPMYLP